MKERKQLIQRKLALVSNKTQICCFLYNYNQKGCCPFKLYFCVFSLRTCRLVCYNTNIHQYNITKSVVNKSMTILFLTIS